MKLSLRQSLIIGAVFLLLTGCGYKTSPRPATAVIPGEVGLIEAKAFPHRVILKWIIPTSNNDGSKITDISGFKVFRSVQKKGEECEDCPQNRLMHANIDFHKPIDAKIDKDEVVYTDKNVSPGNVYSYYVSVYNLRGRESKESPDVTVSLLDLPPAPQTVQAVRNTSGAVELEWSLLDNPDIQGYRIYRCEGDDPQSMKLLVGKKAGETKYTDDTADKNKIYYYAIRSVRMARGVALESEASPSILVRPGVTPPSPRNVSAESKRRGIEVTWDEVDVEGAQINYNIYRSEAGLVYTKINSELVEGTKFTDLHVRRGKTYRYAVTAYAVDAPELESARSNPATVIYKKSRDEYEPFSIQRRRSLLRRCGGRNYLQRSGNSGFYI